MGVNKIGIDRQTQPHTGSQKINFSSFSCGGGGGGVGGSLVIVTAATCDTSQFSYGEFGKCSAAAVC